MGYNMSERKKQGAFPGSGKWFSCILFMLLFSSCAYFNTFYNAKNYFRSGLSFMETAGQRAAWLALMPVTGRTHQLRVHATLLGTPILGDGKYGGKAAFLAELKAARRLHLHARAIALPHPRGGEFRVVAPLPEHMLESWRFFGFDPEDGGDPFAMVGQGMNKGFGL